MLHWSQTFDDPQVTPSIGHIIEPANEQNLNRLHAVLSTDVYRYEIHSFMISKCSVYKTLLKSTTSSEFV
jgi:hypothetical protein